MCRCWRRCCRSCWSSTCGARCSNEPELGLGYPRMLTPHRRPYATKDGYISVIAVSDAHWGRLFDAMGRAGADRGSALRDHRSAFRQRRCAVWHADRGHARTHHRGMAGDTRQARYPVRPGQYAAGPAPRRVSSRYGILPAHAASDGWRCDHHGNTGAFFGQSAIRAPAVAGAWASIPRKCCARSAARTPRSARSRNQADAGTVPCRIEHHHYHCPVWAAAR